MPVGASSQLLQVCVLINMVACIYAAYMMDDVSFSSFASSL